MQRHTQRGLALITAMLVVAIVATIATYLNLGQQVWLRQVQNLIDRGQADNMRHAALDWIGMLLTREAKNSKPSNTDHLGEAWAKDFPPLPYEGGTITVKVTDAQGLFNLNNLVRGNAVSPADVTVFQYLLKSLQIDAALADAVVDWIDGDTEARPGGAEDVEYLASKRPYRTANQKLMSVDELRLIKGFDGKIIEKLRPYVTALPNETPININTAKDKVLEALFNSPAVVTPILETRERQPFTELADMQKVLPPGQAPPQAAHVFETSHFLVRILIGYGRWQRTTDALIYRQKDKPARVLWHHPVYPKLPTDGEDKKT